MREQLMNGVADMGALNEPVRRADPAVVKLLESALEAAKAGKILAVGLVIVPSPTAWQVNMVGPGACEIHIGAAALQAACLQVATTPRVSPIMRASEMPRA